MSSDEYRWHKDESILSNIKRIKIVLDNRRINTLDGKNWISINKEIIKRHKERIKEVQELIDIYTAKCRDLEQSMPGITRYKNNNKALFLDTKKQLFKNKNRYEQELLNNRIKRYVYDAKIDVNIDCDKWESEQSQEFRNKQYEIHDYVNCEVEKKKSWPDATNIIMQSNKDNDAFLAPRIEQALQRYRATYGY